MRFRLSETRLARGDYHVDAFLFQAGGMIDRWEGAWEFAIGPLLPYPARRSDCADQALVYPRFSIDHSARGQP